MACLSRALASIEQKYSTASNDEFKDSINMFVDLVMQNLPAIDKHLQEIRKMTSSNSKRKEGQTVALSRVLSCH